VHVVDGVDRRRLDFLHDQGVEMRAVPRFDRRHPPSNKLSQLQSPAFHGADLIVLTDCDIAFADDVSGLFADLEVVAAKIVDKGKPPHDHWRRIFAAAGFDAEPELAVSTHSREPTYINNFNGGVYVLTREAFEAIRDAWPRWNRWLLAHPEILGDLSFFTDQVSFGLTMYELGLAARPLPSRYNYPTHLADPMLSDPVVLHYHDRVDKAGLLKTTGHDPADARIRRINQTLATEQRAVSRP